MTENGLIIHRVRNFTAAWYGGHRHTILVDHTFRGQFSTNRAIEADADTPEEAQRRAQAKFEAWVAGLEAAVSS